MAYYGERTRGSLKLNSVGRETTIPNNDCARGAYYLHCASQYNYDIPQHLTEYKSSNISQYKLDIVTWMLKLPPSELPFIHHEGVATNNEFLELTIEVLQETFAMDEDAIAALIQGGKIGKKAMLYTANWLESNYTAPLVRLQRGWGTAIALTALTVLVPGVGVPAVIAYNAFKR